MHRSERQSPAPRGRRQQAQRRDNAAAPKELPSLICTCYFDGEIQRGAADERGREAHGPERWRTSEARERDRRGRATTPEHASRNSWRRSLAKPTPDDILSLYQEKKINLDALFEGKNPFEAEEHSGGIDASEFRPKAVKDRIEAEDDQGFADAGPGF